MHTYQPFQDKFQNKNRKLIHVGPHVPEPLKGILLLLLMLGTHKSRKLSLIIFEK